MENFYEEDEEVANAIEKVLAANFCEVVEGEVLGSSAPFDDAFLQKMKDSFEDFADYLWLQQGLPPLTMEQRWACRFLQHGGNYKMLLALRGMGKSIITAAYGMFHLNKSPLQTRVLVVSATAPKAQEITTFMLQCIETIPLLQPMAPGKDSKRAGVRAFDVTGKANDIAPSVAMAGATGQITGKRATLIILDDIEIPSNSDTEEKRQALKKTFGEFIHLTKPDDEVLAIKSEIVVLGTPQSFNSIYNKMDGYNTCIIPAEFPYLEDTFDSDGNRTRYSVNSYNGKLCEELVEYLERNPHLQGEPVSSRFNRFRLEETKAQVGFSEYCLQYMIDTSIADSNKYPLKVENLIVYALDQKVSPASLVWGRKKENRINDLLNLGFDNDYFYYPIWVVQEPFLEYQKKYVIVDTSGRGADKTTYVILAAAGNKIHLLDYGYFAGGYEESTVMKPLVDLMKEHDCHHLLYESNFGDGMFGALFRSYLKISHPETQSQGGKEPIFHISIEEYKSDNKQKELRILDVLEPILSAHRLVVSYDAIKKDLDLVKRNVGAEATKAKQHSLIYQMTHLTRDKNSLIHEDVLETLSIGCRLYLDVVLRDETEAAEEAILQEWEDDIDRLFQKLKVDDPAVRFKGQPYVEYDRHTGNSRVVSGSRGQTSLSESLLDKLGGRGLR